MSTLAASTRSRPPSPAPPRSRRAGRGSRHPGRGLGGAASPPRRAPPAPRGRDVPFVGLNHREAHLYAALLELPAAPLPMVVLLVSGGHTLLVEMKDHGSYRLLGSTIDDAAGEAFDKVARFLGLGYPGGPAIEKAATGGDPTAVDFPRAMLDEGYDF